MFDRRAFLRAGSLGAIGLLVGCGRPDSKPRVAASLPPSAPSGPLQTPTRKSGSAAVWKRVEASGPTARRDMTFTGDPKTGRAYLFGGRAGPSKPLGDLWIFDGSAWKRNSSPGPAPRFGANAAFIDGKLLLFGGQGGATLFFNDLWAFDPSAGTWSRLAEIGPQTRYGAGSAEVDGRLMITHGFTDVGRFDDTWSWRAQWRDDSPAAGGARPVKRCLHRCLWLPEQRRLALFGGQTNTTGFLGDFWLYDPAGKVWTESKPTGLPSARNLNAMFTLGGFHWMFGGRTEAGPTDSLHVSDDPTKSWTNAVTKGARPSPRSGIEAAVVSDKGALIFGGRGESKDLSDLWLLQV